jgi:WD40 repeat protein
MPSRGLSTHDVRRLWRYAVETDFHALNPAVETEGHIMSYESEERFIPFDHPIDKSWYSYATNSNDSLLAIPDKMNIDIYNLDTGARTVLIGHTTKVFAFQFSPTDPNLLVSCSEPEELPNGEEAEHSEIIIWDVRQTTKPGNPPDLDRVAEEGVQAVIAGLGDKMVLADDDSDDIRQVLKSMLGRIHTRAQVPDSSRLDGLIKTNFHSRVFSNSGEYVIYHPAVRGYTNGRWADICLYHLPTRTTTTLKGHRDEIMWTGFSPDDTLIASAGWDGTVRIHDVTGKKIWKFETGKQNWAAVFSPSGEYLASTDGAGILWVWNVKTGEETAKIQNGPRWCRAIDWSPDGKHIIVGSEDWGRLALYSFTDGKVEFAQERKLSAENCDLESIEPRMRDMIGGFLGVHSAQFLISPNDEMSTKLVSSVSVDDGIEVFDFDKGKKWRFVPKRDADGSAIMTKAGDGNQGLVGHVWRKDKGEIGVIAPDGVRLWHLD